MSTICDDLRAAILQAAMQGSLTDSDGESWNESKIEDVCELCTGNSISENVKKAKYMKVVEGRNYIGTKDLLFDHSFNYENGVKIPFDETSFRIANRGDILFCIEGGSAGRKIGILEEDVNYGNKLCRFSPNDKLNNIFLYFYIQSPLFQEQFSGSMTGIIGGVSIKKIKAITIKYPDIAEQKRIVEKVDELMNRVADLEQSADALASLKKAFPDDIKASLLQAAMQGKLTKQLPEDGSAEDLLKEIKAEKEKLIAEGKIKKQKALAPITDDEIPFSIPENWKWARLADLFQFINGDRGKNYPSKNKLHVSGEIPFISAINMQNGTIREDNLLYADRPTYDKLGSGKLNKDDFVICIRGSLGKYCKYPYELGAIASSLIIARKYSSYILDDYIEAYLQSPLLVNEIHNKDNGTAQPNLSAADFIHFLTPVPPLAEQKRIAERLDVLMQNINVVGDLTAREQS
ncbi:MAG: restriction endonuclease subunit S [Candidatus Saccharibacteria bacterium]|nr:restriction endonuclease subunit S [Candidatus Saccharibacteria bacterium]